MKREVTKEDLTKAEVWELIQTLVSGKVAPSRILELYYWSLEPGALELLRNFLLLSQENRAALQDFLGSADPLSISIEAVGTGRLIVTSNKEASEPSSVHPKERARPN